MATDLVWKTEKRKVDDLIPYKHNPRQLTTGQQERLKASFEKFNFVEVPAIDTDNIIIAGHQRLKIMQALGRGEEQIDVRMPNRKLTDEEFKEYNLRSNKNTGHWDIDLLSFFGEDLLKDVGFDTGEMEEIFDTKARGEDKPEVAFTKELLLEHNYVVLYFDNPLDWEVAQEKFRLTKVKDLIPRKGQPKGIGRVISGKEILERIV